MPTGKPNHRVRTLLGQAEIRRRVTELAAEIDRDYAGTEGLVPEGSWLEERKSEMADIRRELGTVTDLERL
ncbi:MAG: hypothetical protein K8H90_03615, partial [Thermoanaerobaculia bacterium]|nr:hypothetical protein [Thermoanaerobaculia bacterium]